jgi:hypothetical protein
MVPGKLAEVFDLPSGDFHGTAWPQGVCLEDEEGRWEEGERNFQTKWP